LKTLPALSSVTLAAALAAACGGAPKPAAPPLFPVATVWRATLEEAIEGPLASDGRRIFVAGRDGTTVALDRGSGSQAWRGSPGQGSISYGSGLLVVRQTDGTVTALDPATGKTRWRTASGVTGSVPAAVAGDSVLVAGEGLASLEAGSGRVAWALPGAAKASAVPVAAAGRLLVGEADGTLRCRDAATGAEVWAFVAPGTVVAPPVVDDRRRVFVGTVDRSFVALDLDSGRADWRWRTGADVRVPAALLGDKVLFASYEDVLYALRRGNGHLAWRAPLPSRPLAGPLVVEDAVLVACHEDEVVGIDGRTGARLGGLRAPAEIATPPLVVDGVMFLGLRDRSVVALRLGGGVGEGASAPSAPPEP